MRSIRQLAIYSLICAIFLLAGCGSEPSPPLNPDEALASFELAPGLKAELVAAEPLVQDPVTITFDEAGRLWVVEMLGFMPDIDGTGEEDPVGRISVLMDTDADGRMDSSVVFLDSLVLPRAIAVVEGGALVAENVPLWFIEDTDGDLRADTKTLIDPEYGGRGLPEHSANGLWRGMDNWYYNAKSKYRYRRIDGEWVRDETEFRGQWGICHDNAGRLHYNYNWSQLHGDLVPPNYLSRNDHHSPTSGIDHGLTLDRRIYPIRSNTAVNRGYVPGTLDEEEKLIEFASACAPFIYRGNALSEEFQGNAFVCEPTGNLIKRNTVHENGFMLSAAAAYQDFEVLASTDERFRPISLASGPDGALYVVDMYRGIIQHGPYMTPYLREVTLSRKLDKPINMGRIWRIVPEEGSIPEATSLAGASTETLINTLSHPNGWHRDMAQRLLVESKDQNILPALKDVVTSGANALGRLHALWTLSGLENKNAEIYFTALTDQDPQVQAAAIRLLEDLSEQQADIMPRLSATLIPEWQSAPAVVQLQTALTAAHFTPEQAIPLLKDMALAKSSSPVMRDAILSSLADREYELLRALLPDLSEADPNQAIFLEALATAIANKGDAQELAAMLALLPQKEDSALGWRESAMLAGLANYSIDDSIKIALPQKPAIYAAAEQYDKVVQSRLSTLAQLVDWPGKPAVAQDEANTQPLAEVDRKQFALGRQQFLNVCSGCHGPDGGGIRRFAPPLRESEWVLGDEKRLSLILLHGMEGPVEVNGKAYDAPEILPVMPSFSTMDNVDLAAIMTYIRREWGHTADPVTAGTVGGIRYRSQGKVTPWKAEELLGVSVDDVID
ncbi:DUF7133 domain-containing protein [Flavilitoribacter nigricans]|uniref:Dehydrogenase n=1 Tax=Flavilitoribacter nigricans (strain ATCC 23147 / DSM 23189 / NBRC 102662 / NCIMB 1420 / SS-2) TaxID=1122177 RepID=A0A2D0N9D3_FLAN2|nr:c-type cytochrome [Flavilitoribacter nigricans]PHN04980.1 dehydrogenase [Flavilitoribacter nigricans DSM 23189 = NBRC 102662]